MQLSGGRSLSLGPNAPLKSPTGSKSIAGGAKSAGTFKGTSCPSGMVKIRGFRQMEKPSRFSPEVWVNYVECGNAPAAPAAPPPPPPTINTNVTVSPNLQQSFTPQFSPNLQQQQGSPGASQGAQTSQSAPGGQMAEGGGTDASSTSNNNNALFDLLRSQSEQQDKLLAELVASRAQYANSQAGEAEEELKDAGTEPQQTQPIFTGGGYAANTPYVGTTEVSAKPAPPQTTATFYERYQWPLIIAGILTVAGFAYYQSNKGAR